MWLTSVCETVGCPMLGLGIAPRIAAVAFALFILLVSLLFLRFWTSRPDTPDFLLRWNNFFGNLAMTLLYVVVAGSLFADLIAGIKEEQQS